MLNAKPKRLWLADPKATPRFYPLPVLRSKASLLTVIGRWPQAEAIHRATTDWALGTGNPVLLAHARTDLAAMLDQMGRIDEAFEIATQAYGELLRMGDEHDRGRMATTLGNMHYHRAEYPRAMEYYREGLAIAQRNGDAAMACRALGRIGLLHYDMGEYQRSLEVLNEALAAAERLGSPQLVATTCGNIGNTHLERGRYDEAMACYQRAHRESLRIGDKQSTAFSEGNIAIIYLRQGRFAEAVEWTMRQYRALREIGDQMNLAISLLNMGNTHYDMGETDLALQRYAEVVGLARANKDKPILSYALYLTGNIHLEHDRTAEGERALLEAISVAEEIGFNHYLCGYQARMARLLVEKGQPDEAAPLAARSRELADKAGRADVLFDLGVTEAMAAGGTPAAIASRLAPLAGTSPDPEQNADLLLRLFRLTGDPARRQAATGAYRLMYEKLPKHSFRQALAELGERVPDRPAPAGGAA